MAPFATPDRDPARAGAAPAPRPRRTMVPRPVPSRPGDDAVTDLVPYRGAVDRSVGDARPDPRPVGRIPGLVGLLLGLLALTGAALVAVPDLALPVLGRAAESQTVLLGLVGVALAGGACSTLGIGPQRRGRPAAVAGLAAAVAAIVALVAPLVALASV